MTYGKTIKLDEHDDFLFDKNSNSFVLATGEDNLRQSLRVLMKTIQGEVALYPTFGLDIYDLVGTDVPDAFIAHALRSALSMDPRVRTVDNVSIQRDGRTIKAAMSIRTTENESFDIKGDMEW